MKTPERAPWLAVTGGSLPAFAAVYVCLYGAFGAESPFFPSFLATRGIDSREIGAVLAAGTAVRIVAGPFFGLCADRFGTRRVLALTAVGAAIVILPYLAASGYCPLLLVSMCHAIAIAPLAPLADALALQASAREGSFPYGWVRGIGSVGFIVGTLGSGLIVAGLGLGGIIVAAAALFLCMLLPIKWLPKVQQTSPRFAWDKIADLLSDPVFRRMLLVAALVIGSHAMNDAFAVIQWRGAGIGPTAIGLLWSAAVASEVLVFFVVGPVLLRNLGPGPCAAIAAMAGVMRWTAATQTVSLAWIGAMQLCHGLTFSLVHLACMQVIANVVPDEIAATAQTLYGTLCLGVASATLTYFSGQLYGSFGAQAFWLMSALCLLAVPLAFGLGRTAPRI